MVVEPIQITNITVSTDHIYGVDKHGQVWFRKRLPSPAYHTSSATEKKKKDEEEEEEARKVWKKLCMNGRVAGEEIPPAKDIPPEIAGAPVNAKPEVVGQANTDNDYDERIAGLAGFGIDGFSHYE